MWLKKGDKEARRVHHQPYQRAETVTPKSKSNQCTEVSLSETLRREDLGPFGREEKRRLQVLNHVCFMSSWLSHKVGGTWRKKRRSRTVYCVSVCGIVGVVQQNRTLKKPWQAPWALIKLDYFNWIVYTDALLSFRGGAHVHSYWVRMNLKSRLISLYAAYSMKCLWEVQSMCPTQNSGFQRRPQGFHYAQGAPRPPLKNREKLFGTEVGPR